SHDVSLSWLCPCSPGPGQQLVPATTFRLTPWCVVTLRPVPGESEYFADTSQVVFAQSELPLDPVPPVMPEFCRAEVPKHGRSLGFAAFSWLCLIGVLAMQTGVGTFTV